MDMQSKFVIRSHGNGRVGCLNAWFTSVTGICTTGAVVKPGESMGRF